MQFRDYMGYKLCVFNGKLKILFIFVNVNEIYFAIFLFLWALDQKPAQH